MNIRFASSLRRRVAVSLSIFLSMSAGSLSELAGAAQAQEAVILGRVTDESGAVLPGVAVTAASPALQVRQVTAVTNELGEYRLAALPIGTYAVEYMLSGFQIVRREGVRLTAGFTARV